MDQSHLDNQYFVDEYTYNCPFCKRRHVRYDVLSPTEFDWSDEKRCYVYFVKCASCRNKSIHWSFEELKCTHTGSRSGESRYRFKSSSTGYGGPSGFDFENRKLDDVFFMSAPPSIFAVDQRIPKVLRELILEAHGCWKGNFLTGASACVRKVVYELAAIEDAEGADYDERIKSLKKVHPDVDPSYFDTLLTIQKVTSTKVHEKSYDGWKSEHLRLILETLQKVLFELYILPAVKEQNRQDVLNLRDEVMPSQGNE